MEGVDGTTVVLEASSAAELAVAFGEADRSLASLGTVEDDLFHNTIDINMTALRLVCIVETYKLTLRRDIAAHA